MDATAIYRALTSGTVTEWRALVDMLPPDPERDRALSLLDSGETVAAFFALVSTCTNYCHGDQPELGADLALALHHVAFQRITPAPVSSTAASLLFALSEDFIFASSRLGRFTDVVRFSAEYFPIYRALWGETDALRQLERGTLRGLLHMRHFDEVYEALEDRPGLSDISRDVLEDLRKVLRQLEEANRSAPGLQGDADPGDYLGVDDYRMAGPVLDPFDVIESSPAPPTPPVSTGFSNLATPAEALQPDQPIVPGEPYLFWLEVNEVAGSIEESPTPLPVDLLPANARLVVVLFVPDGQFQIEPGDNLGEMELERGGTTRVVLQAARRQLGERSHSFPRRLLFPLRAPTVAGDCRLRCNIYCQGVLVQARLIEVHVGGTKRSSRVDYALTVRLDPGRLATLPEHRFSIQMDRRPGGNHEFFVFGGDQSAAFRDSVEISAQKVGATLEIARAAFCRASWGDEDEWAPAKQYRYDGRPDLERLRQDLAVLAIAGYRVYDELANQLAGGHKSKVPEFEKLVRRPGLVQISAAESVGMVLPAAIIYDYRLIVQLKPAAEFGLCAEFEKAFRAGVRYEQTVCAQGRCPSNGLPTTVCPSGFWGFRHALGLPVSEGTDGRDRNATFESRVEYGDAPVIVIGVSRSPDLPLTLPHTNELKKLRSEWGPSTWLVQDRLDSLLEVLRSKAPHIVYLYCHGSGRQAGTAEIPMLFFGENPQNAKPGEWLERSMLRGAIEWTRPRPLVFLNGCHTTKLDAHTTLDFVTGFVQNSNACGVVGTEITVFEPLACEFAKQFLTRFLSGAPVGYAVRDARRDLLQQGNPLGLVYTPFVLGGTRLVKAAGASAA
jgi:CHAT domain-containing protein